MDKETFGPNDIVDLAKRRMPIIGTVFLGIVLASFVIAYSLTNLYAGTATVKIEEPDRPVPWIVEEDDLELMIIRVSDLAMTADNLEPIVEKRQLFAEERGDRPPRSVVRHLRENTEVAVVRDEPEPGERGLGKVIGFRISTYQEDPKTARDTARDLLNLFLKTHELRQIEKMDRVIASLETEEQSLEQELILRENILTEFISEHRDKLPKDREANKARLERKERERMSLDADLRNLETRKTVLQTELSRTPPVEGLLDGDDIKETIEKCTRVARIYRPDHPDVKACFRELKIIASAGGGWQIRQALEEEILRKRKELDVLRRSMDREDPEVTTLERGIESLRNELDGLPTDSPAPEPDNPAYIDLQIQIDSTDKDIRVKRLHQIELAAEIDQLERYLTPAPEIEQEYLTLEREMVSAREQHQQVRKNLQAAEIARRLKDLGVRWGVKSAPTIPYVPEFPNRPLFVVLGIFFGLTFGIGVGLVMEALDGTIRGTRDVMQVMQMPPIAAIPVIKTASDLRRDRVRHIVVACATVATIGLVVLYVRLQINGMI